MTAYIIRRLIHAVIILFIVTLLLFVGMRILPGDPLIIYMGRADMEQASEEHIEQLRQEFGLDKPMMVQYVNWVSDVFHGDLGKSIITGDKVWKSISRSMPITIYLGTLALILYVIVGIPAGMICAVRRGKWLDSVVTVIANIGITVPTFWLGVLMIYFFGLLLGWLPIQGYTSPFDDFWLSTRKIIMPVICLALFNIASTTRQTRSSMLEVINEDYVRTAWSKGLKERVIIARHVLKNGLIPVITLVGMGVRMLFGGASLIETVFNIPGMGRLAVSAMFNQDYPVVQGIMLITVTVVTLSNLLVDISYGWLDPKIRYN